MSSAMADMEEYFRINVEKRVLIKAPEQEDYEITPATRLLEKRREMQEVDNGLTLHKDEFYMKMESLNQRREELARKEKQLEESLLKFDKFLKENDAKRDRAVRKANEERKVKESKDSEIETIKDNLQNLVIKENKQRRSVNVHFMFQRCLESVLETGEDFGEVKDIIARFDTLAATNAELQVRAKIAQDQTEQERKTFSQFLETQNNEILNCNNTIAKLQTKLEDAISKSVKYQLAWDATLKGATQKSLLIGQVKMAANNLFNTVKGHKGNTRLRATTDTIAQLDKIEQFMTDLNHITKDLGQDLGDER